jgi:CMP-N-acetylneuraminic acid synthetase
LFKDRKVLGLICARGGSKGVPKKNIKLLGGKPLIGWSIETATQCTFFDRVVVSTDSQEIANIAMHYGAEVPFIRPAKLAEDESPEWLSWQHALKKLEELDQYRADYLIVLPPTSPFRSHEDVEQGFDLIKEEDIDMVISVTNSGRNPYFNMVEIDRDGFAYLSKKPEQRVFRRQDASQVFDMTTALYAARTDYILYAHGVFDGKVKVILIPEIRALDIDTEMDFKLAEFLISEGLIN